MLSWYLHSTVHHFDHPVIGSLHGKKFIENIWKMQHFVNVHYFVNIKQVS